jgi:hypothetical protein
MAESVRRRDTQLRRWAHRRGIARVLNERYSMGAGFMGAYVQTALPVAALARYAAGRYGLRVVSRERVGLLAWRWQLQRRGRP